MYDSMLKPAFVFDGRKILNHSALAKIGFHVETIGKRHGQSFQVRKSYCFTFLYTYHKKKNLFLFVGPQLGRNEWHLKRKRKYYSVTWCNLNLFNKPVFFDIMVSSKIGVVFSYLFEIIRRYFLLCRLTV